MNMSSKKCYMRSAKILITGGAGFIGSALAKVLRKDNEIVIFDNFSRGYPVEQENTKLIQGNVTQLHDCDVGTAFTHIIHAASIAGVDTVLKNPETTMNVALLGTKAVLDFAMGCQNIKRVLNFSTSEVFGQYAYKVAETDTTTIGAIGEARWTYAISKLAAEHWAYVTGKERGLPVVSVRPFNIFGPGQVGEGAIHHFIRAAIQDKPLLVNNGGSQIRSWCFIDDMVHGASMCLRDKKAIGHSFNIGNPRNTLTIYALAKQIISLAKSKSVIKNIFKPGHTDIEIRIPDINKATTRIGFYPTVDLEEGLLETIEWYRHEVC